MNIQARCRVESQESAIASTASDEFSGLMRSHIGWIFRMARRQLCDAALAEDATQAVFLDLWRKRIWTLGYDRRVGGWLVRATQHACNNLRRTEQRRMTCERKAARMRAEDQRLMAEHSTDSEQLAALDAAMPHLSSSDQDILVARFYQKQSVLEVAEQLGITEAAAEKRIRRAMDRLGAAMLGRPSSKGTSSLVSLLIVGLGTTPPGLAEKVLQIIEGGAAMPPPIAHAARKLSPYWPRIPITAAIVAVPLVASFLILMPVMHKPVQVLLHASPSRGGSANVLTRMSPQVALPASQSLHGLQLKIKVRTDGSENAAALTDEITRASSAIPSASKPLARSTPVGLGGPNPQADRENKGPEKFGGQVAAK